MRRTQQQQNPLNDGRGAGQRQGPLELVVATKTYVTGMPGGLSVSEYSAKPSILNALPTGSDVRQGEILCHLLVNQEVLSGRLDRLDPGRFGEAAERASEQATESARVAASAAEIGHAAAPVLGELKSLNQRLAAITTELQTIDARLARVEQNACACTIM